MHLTLDGTWDLIVGDPGIAGLADAPSRPVTVPGLWEAEVDPALDGVAWYRRTFDCPDPYGRWTLRFKSWKNKATSYANADELRPSPSLHLFRRLFHPAGIGPES